MQHLPALKLTLEFLQPTASVPKRANSTDACFDLRASQASTIAPGETGIVGLGWSMQLESGWEARIRGRSGLASRGIIAHYGTIDHLYRQEVKVILHNLSSAPFVIEVGDRIAQMSFAPVFPVEIIIGEVELTQRGGFGSTGLK